MAHPHVAVHFRFDRCAERPRVGLVLEFHQASGCTGEALETLVVEAKRDLLQALGHVFDESAKAALRGQVRHV